MTSMSEQMRIRFVLIRGGTSKALFLRRHELPADPVLRDAVILELFGSPDARQIDGLGGADLLTSKLAIIGAATPDADLAYTFGQVSITERLISYDMNCGNISAGVGAYAVDEGLVEPVENKARVRIYNTNTGRILLADVPVLDGLAAVAGDFQMDGVPGTGAPILLDYQHTAGGATGALLPTGRERDSLAVPELSTTMEVSFVDIGNLCVFFPAKAAGMTGLENSSRSRSLRRRPTPPTAAAGSWAPIRCPCSLASSGEGRWRCTRPTPVPRGSVPRSPPASRAVSWPRCARPATGTPSRSAIPAGPCRSGRECVPWRAIWSWSGPRTRVPYAASPRATRS